MTGLEILAEAARNGLKLEIRNGRLVVGADGDRPTHLLDMIRAKKTEVLCCLLQDYIKIGEQSETSEESARTRLHLPQIDLPLTAPPRSVAVWPSPVAVELFRRVYEQGMPAIGWCIARANDYFQRFPDSSFEEQEVAAAADLLDWQDEFMASSHETRKVFPKHSESASE